MSSFFDLYPLIRTINPMTLYNSSTVTSFHLYLYTLLSSLFVHLHIISTRVFRINNSNDDLIVSTCLFAKRVDSGAVFRTYDTRRLPPFTVGSVCQTSLAFFDNSIVTVVSLPGILGLRTEGPESFSSSDVCSESSSAIACSLSSSEDGS